MKDLLESLKELNFPVSKIIQQPIVDNEGLTLAWNFYVQNKEGISLAGGTNVNSEIAKTIAIAESFERALAKKISMDPIKSKEFLMDLFPTSCGFASGFDQSTTKLRAIKEAVERWAWSKWIDESFQMNEIELKNKLANPLSQYIFKLFPKVRIHRKDGILVLHKDLHLNYSFLVLILENENGVFAGCRAGPPNEDLISHSAIEAFRNYQNFKLLSKNDALNTNSVVAKRNIYFATHKEEAFEQIKRSTNKSWPQAEISILKEYPTMVPGVFLWRCLMKDFLGWHIGDVKRFVY
jgi:hypothetical protein